MQHAGVYFLIWLILLLLLAATVGSSFLEMGILNPVSNLAIAIAKTALIMIFFMRLRGAGGMVPVAAAAGFFWLALLFALTLGDYMTRG